jgi:type IV secretion system protein VirB8
VVSVRLPQDEPGKAVVSYEKTIYGPQNPNPLPQRYISTISYQYSTSQKNTEKVWIENPFGFQVTAYRTDPEINETVK